MGGQADLSYLPISRAKLIMAEQMQKNIQAEVDKLKAVQKDYNKYVTARQQLDAQLNENRLVKDEMTLLEDGCSIYKMVGPVLVKQDVEDSRQNVDKRIQYIESELKRHDALITDLDKKQEGHKDKLVKLQQSLQQQQVKMAAKAP